MNKVLLKCTIASALGGLLFGYDTVIINGAMLDLVKYFQLSPALQGWTVSSALIGCILGTILIGRPGDLYGAKRLLQLLAVMFLASSAGCAVATDISIFIIFRFIGGLAIGVVFYYSAQIFSIAGFSNGSSMAQSVILGVTNLIFTLIAMSIIDKAGRKSLLLFGQMGMVVVLGFFGTTQVAQQTGMSYAFIFFAVVTFIGFIYLKKYIIETKGKTLENIEKEVLCGLAVLRNLA